MADQLTPQQQNAIARLNLLTTGIAMTSQLQPVNATLGQQIRIPLRRMGIMTGVLLQFTIPVTIATNPAVPSVLAPFNFANQVTYTDFTGTQRTQTHGYQLWAAQAFKQGDLLGAIPSAASAAGGAVLPYNYNTNILNLPTAVGASNIRFSLYVPMAYDPASDLTGAVLTQTNVGEHFITIQIPNDIVGADPWKFPYAAADDVEVTGPIVVEAFQNYIQPQAMDVNNLPLLDLSTIYGFEGGFLTTANIGANQSTYINLPNNRSILSTLVQYQNGGAYTVNETDIARVVLLANSNTNFREMTPRFVREQMRNIANSDVAPSSYYIGSRRQPILTQLYANVQTKFDVLAATAGAGTFFASQYEVQYPSGAPLPGITMAA